MKKEQRIRNRHIKEDENYETQALANILKDFQGRRFLWWLLSETGIARNPFAGNALNMAHETGKMAIGQIVLDRIMNLDATAYGRMLVENKDLIDQREAELNEAREEKDSYDVD